jgi:hypothetical protein
LQLCFTEKQISIIDFYIYGRINEAGEVLGLEDPITKEVDVLMTPDDLWDYIKIVK